VYFLSRKFLINHLLL